MLFRSPQGLGVTRQKLAMHSQEFKVASLEFFHDSVDPIKVLKGVL